MADAASSIFNKKAADKLRSADDLDRYVQVTNPGVWMVLIASVALLIGLFAWGVFGSVTTTINTMGVSVGDTTVCFLNAEEVSKIHIGDETRVGVKRLEVKSISAMPLSRAEAKEILGSDYLAETLVTENWEYFVTFTGETDGIDYGKPFDMSITVERVAPISLLLGGNG
ncbi:MAG: hypothetical protein IJ125_01240 [Atopobiaceae bacterium]|nr:hypothetical protein [Atopobiaceae bacterium]